MFTNLYIIFGGSSLVYKQCEIRINRGSASPRFAFFFELFVFLSGVRVYNLRSFWTNKSHFGT